MQVERTVLPEVLVLTPKRFGDQRGYFSEVYNKEVLLGHGVAVEFVQDNHSFSRDMGVVRGLHCQTPPHAQDKLVRVGAGRVIDVAVDIRKGSPNYGKWVAVELSAEEGNQIFVPKGFLHGFSTLEPNTEILYKCSDFYAPDMEASVRFDDPDLEIDWGIGGIDPILSAKDAVAPSLKDLDSPFIYEE